MTNELFKFLCNIPLVVSQFGNWLISPINERWLNISPLAMLGIGGTAFIITIITTHVVRLFI